MPFDYTVRSADLKVHDFPEGTTNTDIVKAIVEYFTAQNVTVLAVQQCANKIARVTFDDRTACELIRLRLELDINGVKVPVVPPPPPPPNWVNVVVYNLPFDAPNAYIEDVLGYYGTIDSIRYQHWTNLPEIATGTRIVRINLRKSIPRFVKIHTHRCKVWYRGQPISCDICKEGTHIASSCPYKGKCLACKGSGHFARNCPTVCFKCKGDHASDSCPNRRRWEHAPRAEDDTRSVSSDVDGNDVTPVASDDLALAEAASVAEVVVGAGFSLSASDASHQNSSDDLSPSGALFSVPEVVVIGDEDVSPPSPSHVVLDERFNQLDELASQASQSILPNCRPGVVPPGGESVNSSQISNSSTSSRSIPSNCGPVAASSGGEFAIGSQISNSSASDTPILPNCGPGAASSGGEFVNTSQISTGSSNSSSGNGSVTESNLSLEINVNHYGSAVPPDSTPPGPSSITDSVMTQASDPRKRPISETSSDDTRKSKSKNKKVPKKSGRSSHLPISIATAVRSIAPSRVLARK